MPLVRAAVGGVRSAASVRSDSRETVDLSQVAGPPAAAAAMGWRSTAEAVQLDAVGARWCLPGTARSSISASGDTRAGSRPASRQGGGPLPEIRVEEWGRRSSSPINSDATLPLGRRARTDSLASDSSSLAGSCDSLSSCGSAARRGLMTPDDGSEPADTLSVIADSLRRFYRLKPPGQRYYRITVSEMLEARATCGVSLKVDDIQLFYFMAGLICLLRFLAHVQAHVHMAINLSCCKLTKSRSVQQVSSVHRHGKFHRLNVLSCVHILYFFTLKTNKRCVD